MTLHNAELSTDLTKVICDYGTYHLTGDEMNDPESAIQPGALKCKAAYDCNWAMRRDWDWRSPLTASTVLTAA